MQQKVLCCLLASVIVFSSYQTYAQRPNIIYIMTDDMGYGDLGSYGQKSYATPNLDKLASQGIRFTHAYSAGAVCTPTRAAFMTGRYPARCSIGLKEPLIPTSKDSAFGLSKSHPSVAALLKQQGYETALIGKWHLGFLPEFSPNTNGFDKFYGFLSGASDYISHKSDGRRPDLYENGVAIEKQGYLTDIFTEKAISFVKATHKSPFFLVLNYNVPHWPWQGPSDNAYHDTVGYRTGGSPAIYTAMMRSLDDNVGLLMKALDETGLNKNTLVIFTNDNGGERFSNNGGLAKMKGSLYEGGIRVPAFVRWPGKIKAGKVSTQPVITMDWTATIVAVSGAKPDAAFPLDGINLLPLMEGKVNERERSFYWRTFQRSKQKATRQGKWKYLQVNGNEFLFDLEVDPAETTDLKKTHKVIFERLRTKMGEWEKEVLQPIPL